MCHRINLKNMHLKTAAPQKRGVDCVFLQFGIIIIYRVLNLGFKKMLQSVTSFHNHCSVQRNFICSKSIVTKALYGEIMSSTCCPGP